MTNNQPKIVMVQGLFCGHCVKSKPAFDQFAAGGNGFTIQIDEDKDAADKIRKAFGSAFRGVPHYYGVNFSGKFLKHHEGGRSFEDLQKFYDTL